MNSQPPVQQHTTSVFILRNNEDKIYFIYQKVNTYLQKRNILTFGEKISEFVAILKQAPQ